MLRPLLISSAVALTLGLTACATSTVPSGKLFGLLTPYKMDIVQGNVVTKEQLARVRPGMTRNQVSDVLGTPLITDLFHADRWDYPFTIRRQGTEPQLRTVIVRFKDDVMVSIEAPDLPSEQEFIAAISKNDGKTYKPRALELTEEQRKALPVPPPKPVAAAEPTGPVRDYPPLEPKR